MYIESRSACVAGFCFQHFMHVFFRGSLLSDVRILPMTQADALDILKMGYNCFLTGAAGSGKTHVVNEYVKFLKKNNVSIGITASTGIAATHLGGQTIHSWSGLGVVSHLSEYDLEAMEEKKYLADRFKDTKVLIIDEVSMLHHFRLDLVDKILRHLKKNQLPFGGMQVVLVGDFFQLPPVAKAGEPEALFVYQSEAWRKLDLKICYLEEQHRHKDEIFLKILNSIRDNTVSESIIASLRGRYDARLDTGIEPTKLHTHNANVDAINDAALAELSSEMFAFHMETKGRSALVEALKKSCLAPEVLRLKVGARVMFVKNNFDAGYANGTLGRVIECNAFGPKVMLVNGKIIAPEKESWVIEEEGKTKAMITQYPLRLAWAITVHKSQGMSMDAVEVDLSQSFEKGMGYVALSRVRTLAGLRLLGLNKNALQVREDVMLFDEKLREASHKASMWLASLSGTDIAAEQKEFLEKIAPKDGEKKKIRKSISPLDETRNMLQEGMSLKEILQHKGVKIGTLLDHIEKIIEKDPQFDVAHLQKEVPAGKFKKIYQTFRDLYGENRDFLLAPVKTKLGDGYSYEDLRVVRLFVRKYL